MSAGTGDRGAKKAAVAKMDSSAYRALKASNKRSKAAFRMQKAALRTQLNAAQAEAQRGAATVDFLLGIIVALVRLLRFLLPSDTVARMVYLMVRPFASPVGQNLGGIRGGALVQLCQRCGWNQAALEAGFVAQNPQYAAGQVGPVLPVTPAGQWWLQALGRTSIRLDELLLPGMTDIFENGVGRFRHLGQMTTESAKRFMLGMWLQDEYNKAEPGEEDLYFNGV